MSELPRPILQMIAKCCTTAVHLALGRTCKLIADIARSPLSWPDHIEVFADLCGKNKDRLSSLSHLRPTSLNIECRPHEPRVALPLAWLRDMRELRSLRFGHCSIQAQEVHHLKALTLLATLDCRLEGTAAQHVARARLRSLTSLPNQATLTRKEFEVLADADIPLTEMDLRGKFLVDQLNDYEFIFTTVRSFPLRALHFPGWHVLNSYNGAVPLFNKFASTGTLQTLSLSAQFPDGVMNALLKCLSLQNLTLFAASPFTKRTLETIAAKGTFQLRSLAVIGVVTKDVMDPIPLLTSLTSLDLGGAPVLGLCVPKLFSLTGLRSLTLAAQGGGKPSTADYTGLAKHLRALERLDIGRCDQNTSAVEKTADKLMALPALTELTVPAPCYKAVTALKFPARLRVLQRAVEEPFAFRKAY